MINIDRILSGIDDEIDISGKYSIDSSYYSNTDIKRLNYVNVIGKIYKDVDDKLIINMNISGEMVLLDSISMEEVKYEFSTNIDDKLEDFVTNIENTIDIIEILWQNIVLEVPLRYTVVDDTRKLTGDGWKLVSDEDMIRNNNPFSVLLENEEKE